MKYQKLIKNSLILFISLSLAWWVFKSEQIHNLVEVLLPVKFIADILAGVFYTSFLTTPLSLAMLIVLAENNNPILLAVLGGLGAVLGDLIIVKLFKDRIFHDFSSILNNPLIKKTGIFLRKNKLDFLIQVTGVMIIASPFPDELGLMLLGATELKYKEIALLSYLLNTFTLGILFITLPINLL